MASSYLEVKARTWARDSHGLFDYDAQQTVKDTQRISASGSLLRKGNEILFNSEVSSPVPGLLLKIFDSVDHYLICPVKHEQVGLVIKKQKPQSRHGFKLAQGDIIKIGRVKLKVKEINQGGHEQAEEGMYDGSFNNENTCRICFRTHCNIIDPLIPVCKCSGSMELVHLLCLRRYLLSKAIKKNFSNCISYLWKSIQCDVCKENLPLTIKYNNQVYDTIAIGIDNSNYITLEDYRRHKYKFILHLITPNDAPFLIGRATDTDLKIGDISVSRSHLTIELFKNEFYIKDNGSKFGTLVIQKKPIIVSKFHTPSLQIGRTVLKFSYKTTIRPFNCLTFCCKKSGKVDNFPKSRTEIVWEEESFRSSEQYEGGDDGR